MYQVTPPAQSQYKHQNWICSNSI